MSRRSDRLLSRNSGALRRGAPVLLVLVFALLAPSEEARAERLSPELLWKLGRVSSGVVSPPGEGRREVAYLVRRYELAENGGTTEIRVVGLDGRSDRAVASGLVSAGELQWVRGPNGARLWFAGKRDKDAATQAWRLDVSSGALEEVTKVEGGITTLKVAPTGARLAYTARVGVGREKSELYRDLPEADGEIIDALLFRHWDSWRDGKYSHIFVADIDESGAVGEARDLMARLEVDCPMPPFGGSEHYAWSPDGDWIAFTAKMVSDPAQSTDSDIYLVRASGEGRTLCMTGANEGYDTDPVFSPNGQWIAYHSMEEPGFESDRNRIFLFSRGTRELREVTAGLDRTSHGVRWSPDSKALYFASEDRGREHIFKVELRGGTVERVTEGRYNWSLRDVAEPGTLVLGRQSMLRPWELFRLEEGEDGGEAEVEGITSVNDGVFASLELPTIEERWIRSTDEAKVHSWIIYPPDFDPEKKWPLLTYCQGGPQSQIGQWFSYRWNFHLMAAQGYVVLAVNRRGLPGFGREWNDAISGDWGGQAMDDILAATDSLLSEPWVDRDRVGAIGASFGGYTVYWLMGNHRRRFKAMIAHCGVFNLESMYGSTEELFFVDKDLGGPYWKSAAIAADYERFSPHRFVGEWSTPLLVIHGEKDFRVPVTQGIEAFTAAQVSGVPSRFLYFPSEGHWVLSPQNGVLWHRVFFDWLDRWLAPAS